MKRFSIYLASLLLVSLPMQAEMISCPSPCCQPCWGVEGYGEYLYWKVSEDQLHYAATLEGVHQDGFDPTDNILGILEVFRGSFSTAGAILVDSLTLVEPEFHYNSGFRVGLGFNFGCCNNWHANAEYTRLHHTTNSSVTDDVNGVFPIGFPLLPSLVLLDRTSNLFILSAPTTITNQFQFRYDAVDLQFGPWKQWGCFCTRPYFGGKGTWIRQRSNTTYLGLGFESGTIDDLEQQRFEFFPIAASLNKRNDFKSGGLEIGFDSAYKFWGSLALTGGFQAALLYGHFSVESAPSFIPSPDTALPPLVGTVKGFHENRIRPMIDAYVGLDWNTCFCSRWIFTVGAAWELQYFWNQWQAPSSVDATIFRAGDAPEGDLALQGLTVFASLTF